MSYVPPPEKHDEIDYTAVCPEGHDATWTGSWRRVNAGQKDIESLTFHCPVCDA